MLPVQYRWNIPLLCRKKEPPPIAPTKDMGGRMLLSPTISTVSWSTVSWSTVYRRGHAWIAACSRTTMRAYTSLQFPNNSYMIYNSFLLTGSQIGIVLLQYSSQLAIHA
jgi:hypothetical protein